MGRKHCGEKEKLLDRKLSKWVENTLGKGEIARNKQFLLFPECFQKACFPGASKGVIVWEWVNALPSLLLCLEWLGNAISIGQISDSTSDLDLIQPKTVSKVD